MTENEVGTANCDHENEEEVYRDQFHIFSKCTDCGAETMEDR